MNEKITRQIEEMKKQTLGVEVEMNIKRQGSKDCCHHVRNRQISEYGKPERILHMVSLGRAGKRMEIPKGCQHFGTRQ